MSDEPTVDVIVITYNSAAVLGSMLGSLDEGLKGLRWRLIVADNASADDSVAIAQQMVPSSIVVQTGRNAGYAAAFNAGLKASDGADAVLILNPDIRLTPGSVLALMSRLGADAAPGRRVGIAVPRLLEADGRLALSLRREPTVSRALGEAVLGQRGGRFSSFGEVVTDPAAYERETVVDWATGAAMLMSAECLAAVGDWDERFFLYSEETDFSLRARDMGYATAIVPAAEAVHLRGESSTSPRLFSLLVLNKVRFYRKRHGRLSTGLFWTAVFLRELSRTMLGNACSRRALVGLVRPARVMSAFG
jgi:GT2 family glycosyltransferase